MGAIITNGLVGCWDAASKRSYPGSGSTWKDISGEGNDATVNSAPVFVNQNGGYLNFDGTDDYFTYDLYSGFDNAWIQSIDISIEVWVRIKSNSNCCGGYWAFGTAQFEMALSSNSPKTSAVYTVTGGWGEESGTTNLDYWYCYTVTHAAGTTFKLYVDGALDSSHTLAGNTQFTSGTGSFGTNNNGSYLEGDIAVVRMYDRVLTASEIRENYVAQRGRFTI